jgi:hypothetical protein
MGCHESAEPCAAHGLAGSCWTWTGSPEAGDLSATPSLAVVGECGFHGFLRGGVLA